MTELMAATENKLENVLIMGDLSKLSPEERVMYYKRVCESVHLNPLTRPFDYITLNGKLTLYAKKDATDQIRYRDGVSITKLDTKTVNDIYIVTAYATTANGRSDASTGAVSIANIKGDVLANALMKAETKAKRRVTLSICGLGLLDETELETIRDAVPTVINDNGIIEVENGHAPEEQSLPEPIHNSTKEVTMLEIRSLAGKKGVDARGLDEIFNKHNGDLQAAYSQLQAL